MPHLEDNGFVRMAKSMEAYVSDIQYINTWKTSQGQKGDMVQTAIPDVNLRRLRTENSSGDGTKGNSQPLNLLLLAWTCQFQQNKLYLLQTRHPEHERRLVRGISYQYGLTNSAFITSSHTLVQHPALEFTGVYLGTTNICHDSWEVATKVHTLTCGAQWHPIVCIHVLFSACPLACLIAQLCMSCECAISDA